MITLFTGIITGFFAVGLTKSVGVLSEYKMEMVNETLEKEGGINIFLAFLKFWIFGSILVSIATGMVRPVKSTNINTEPHIQTYSRVFYQETEPL